MARFMMSRNWTAWSALFSALVLFVAINVIAQEELVGSRIDLTENHLYTLSPGTRKVLAEIQEPITLRFYYSPELGQAAPPYGIYAGRVREMLEQYAALAPGKIKLVTIDPKPFSSQEDRAVAFGLQGVALREGGDQVYFGLAATNATDDQQIIAFFQPDRERFLEYDLTKLIYSLAFPQKTVVGLMSNLPLEGDFEAAMRGAPLVPYTIYEQMHQLYDIDDLSSSVDKIPADVKVLMIVQPQQLPERTLYAIDQYVLKGGKALIFVDPYSEVEAAKSAQQAYNPAANASNLQKLFKAWGLEMVPGMVAGDRANARRVNVGTDSDPHPLDYVGWLALGADNVDHDSPITGNLSALNFASAGILEPEKGATSHFTPLVFTSRQSEEIPVAKVMGLPDVQSLLDKFKPSGKRLVLAARVSGMVHTAFPHGPPTPPVKTSKDPPPNTPAAEATAPETRGGQGKAAAPAAERKPPSDELLASTQPINVVVVADTDLLSDRFWVDVQNFVGQRVAVPIANNGDLVTNAIDTLSGGDALIGLRTRGTAERPFTLVKAIQRAANERYEATEKGLEQKLKETQTKIKQLSGGDTGSAENGTVSLEQAKTLDSFRTELLRVRRQLREVQLALRLDIDHLRNEVEFFDIGAIPILVGVVAIVLGLVRMSRRRRRAHAR
jgi:gliding motility-associatede transport system auxiliary component